MHIIFYMSVLALASGSQLLSVIVIHRHGDRNPLKSYKNDPYRDESHWPEGFAQLSKRGIQRQYDLGVWLRSRYSRFLPARYSPRVLRARSTDVDRTLMSAELTLAGLFPPTPEEKWSEEINWRPIPVHTTPKKEDPLLAMKKPCKKHSKLMKRVLQSRVFTEINEINRDLFEFLSKNSGDKIGNIFEVEKLYNTLLTQSMKRMKLPEWTGDVFPEKMKSVAILKYKLPCYNLELTRLKTGLLFGEIVKHFRGFTGNSTGERQKLLMFSGHDSTLANVLMTMGVFSDEIPEYSSAIIMELHRNGTDYGNFVNLFLKNNADLHNLVLKNCDFDCDFEDFVNIFKPILVDNIEQWELECEN